MLFFSTVLFFLFPVNSMGIMTITVLLEFLTSLAHSMSQQIATKWMNSVLLVGKEDNRLVVFTPLMQDW